MEPKRLKYRLIVGLGNPGTKYALTRHNMGFMVVGALGRSLGWVFKEDKRMKAQVAKGDFEGGTLHLLMPTTYMNLSGEAIRRYMGFYRIPVSELLVVLDDSALAFGEMRVRAFGGSGGHNGLKSIEAYVGTQRYSRLRLGIGDSTKGDLVDHVLSNFDPHEREILPTLMQKAVNVIMQLVKEDIHLVMNQVNKRSGGSNPLTA